MQVFGFRPMISAAQTYSMDQSVVGVEPDSPQAVNQINAAALGRESAYTTPSYGTANYTPTPDSYSAGATDYLPAPTGYTQAPTSYAQTPAVYPQTQANCPPVQNQGQYQGQSQGQSPLDVLAGLISTLIDVLKSWLASFNQSGNYPAGNYQAGTQSGVDNSAYAEVNSEMGALQAGASGNPFTSAGNPYASANAGTAASADRKTVVLDDVQGWHGQAVADVYQQTLAANGVDGAEVVGMQMSNTDLNYQNLGQAVDSLLSGALNDRAQEIQSLAGTGQIGQINISNGMSPADIVLQLTQSANADPAVMNDMQASMGITGNQDPVVFLQKLSEFVGQRAATSPEFQQAIANYQSATKFAESQNVAVVVASGNAQEEVNELRQYGVNVSEDSGLNLLANSDSVFVVGASDAHDTASKADDSSASFSSHGGNITVAANGVDVLGNADLDGTSFSAPQVTAMIAALRKQNPFLSVAQIKQIIQGTAMKNHNVGAEAEGAGDIYWAGALAAAQQSAMGMAA